MRMTDSHSSFDFDAYIAALPRHNLEPPMPNAPRRYQVSRYPLLRAYNGFTGEERRRGGQLIGWLQAARCLPRPSRCDICGRTGRTAYHSEHYYSACHPVMICNGCHMAIHRRQFAWDQWRRIVDGAATTGREWFVLIPRHGIDVAQHLRDRWGWAAADLERSPVCPLADAIVAALPDNMLSHPAL